MPRPTAAARRRHARWAAVCALASLAAAAVCLSRAESIGRRLGALPVGLLAAVLMVAVLASLAWLGISLVQARSLDRLERGVGILARWTITPAQLAGQLARRRQLDAQPGVAPTSPALSKFPTVGDTEVIITRDAVFIGDALLQTIGEHCVAARIVDGDWLEIDWYRQDDVPQVLRAPIAPGAMLQAEQAAAELSRRS